MKSCRSQFCSSSRLSICAEEKKPDDSRPDDYISTPWHLVDTWWDIGRDVPFESYSIDVTISEDVSPEVNLYIAPIGRGDFGKTIFYGGIQTQADGNTKKDQRLRKIGPGFLFSMWGAQLRRHPALGGQYELFKTTQHFDSTAQHPEYLGGELSRTKELTGSERGLRSSCDICAAVRR